MADMRAMERWIIKLGCEERHQEIISCQIEEYAVTADIGNLPTFSWWIPYTMKKRSRILSKLKSKYWLRTHKYSCEIPKTIADANRIDTANKKHYGKTS